MSARAIHCSFTALPPVTRRTTYRDLKRAVLKAGRFSVFDAMDSDRSARMFTKLCRDPSVRTRKLAFPWTTVSPKPKRKAKK